LNKFSKKNYNKIGILGGTFDPPHVGHLFISKIALKKIKLKKIIWVVTKKNPLKKKPHLNSKIRIKLSKEMTKKEKKISVKYFDNKIKSSNTFDLLNYIKKKNEKTKLYFIMGADSLKNFHKWSNWIEIPKLAKMIVFARQNYSMKSLSPLVLKKLNKSDWIYINSKKINISSSLIRKIW